MKRLKASNPLMVIGLLAAASPAFAAKVLSIKADKGIVVLDEGKGGGFTKGSELCIYDSSDTEVACGKVSAVTDKNTAIRVAKDKIAGIEKGMAARGKDASAPAAEDGAGKKKGAGKTPAKASAKYMRNLKLMYVPGMVPAPFSQLSYGLNKDSGDTEFKEISTNSFGLIGLGLEFEMPVGAKTLALGFRYRMFSASTAQADLSKTVAAHYWETQESGTAIGLWFDYYFMQSVLGKSSIFKLGSGLDIDQSTVDVTVAAKTDDASKALPTTAVDGSIQSKTMVVSLRIPASFLLFFDPMGLNFDIVPMIPLVEMGNTLTISPEGTDDATTEVKEALKHKKASFAVDLRMGLFFAF